MNQPSRSKKFLLYTEGINSNENTEAKSSVILICLINALIRYNFWKKLFGTLFKVSEFKRGLWIKKYDLALVSSSELNSRS